MHTHIKTNFLFYTFTLFVCLNFFFLRNTAAQVSDNYTFETIDVPGVDFLGLAASSDFEDYAGYTPSADGEKFVAFTLIDGVYTTYDFPDSQNTYFYALGNNGIAAGHYENSEGLFHGVILENGELRQYDFPNSVETEIYGYSDSTGALTGNFTDASGVRRGFSGETIVEFPGASETYADFVSGLGNIVGSYVDTEGAYHAYLRGPGGSFATLGIPEIPNMEYFFLHGINDALVAVGRAKAVDGVPRTFVGNPVALQEFKVPGAVSTEGWNVNQDGSVVGHYDTADGRRHGFIARPAQASAVRPPPDLSYTFESIDVPGVDFLAVTASSDFQDYAGNMRGPDGEKDVAFTLIDGVFTTYDFPDSQGTYFYALGNNGVAAGHYEDSDGLFHGVILENGELRQYDFPDAVETEIYGYSDSTGALTGSFVDTSGVRRGFSGDTILEFPGALETYADFANGVGNIVGSYVDAEGTYYAYTYGLDGRFASITPPEAPNEYFFLHGLNDAVRVVARSKTVGDVPRTYVGYGLNMRELQFPGSVSTEGWNINQDGSIVGHYDSADGRRHGFIARPAAPVNNKQTLRPASTDYTFESIDVPGVEFLELTASNDFGDYAGNTRSPDGKKIVGFTLIDGVFTTYDFPSSQNTYFFALGNNGNAAGHYEDSEGLFHGVVLENGELREYNFPDSVETEIYGISDATGALTGNFIDASGVRRGFSGDKIVEYPGATATYADFVNRVGNIVGSYIDAEGTYHAYAYGLDGRFLSATPPKAPNEYFFLHGFSDAGTVVARSKAVSDIPRTYVGTLLNMWELRFPGSVSTEGWNINQDGSIVGHYDSADGRRHGFIARPVDETESTHFGNFSTVTLSKGLNMISVPLAPPTPMTAKSLAAITGATTIIMLDAPSQRFVAWTPSAPNDGFTIEGGQGYVVNVPETRNFAFVGAPWTDQAEGAAAPSAISTEAWAFVVSGRLEGKSTFDGYQIIVRNLRTNSMVTTSVQGDYFAAATADLTRRSVIRVGDVVELRVIGPGGNAELQTLAFKVTPEDLANAVLSVNLDGIGQPTQNQLLQNYPNPFNPETWIPYQLSEDTSVSVSIYDTTGQLVRTLSLGFQAAGFYNSQGRAAYWDGRNALGERVASGIYFYQLTTPSFQQTRRLVIVK
ncbi:MAG: T9SS type A sorting domain-containing protein [Candidatus Poribacteria bacterium]|nr:T9SS type A sorting domain-containing protein [Candidatus Poribacteria bacterium]MDE0468838.1 T9SS type A sorting domain-containing protein [Candidatus Poribacteria bacterium]